jgi:transposase-like protein
MVSFKGAQFKKDIILTCVRWYVAYPLSCRQLEELMEERGVSVDHATIHRWVLKYAPQIEAAFHRRKRLVSLSWRLDETYIKVRGHWHYPYRAADKAGHTIDCLLTTRRDRAAALRFPTKAIRPRRFAATGYPRRSSSTGARPTRQPSRATTRPRGPRSPFGRYAISTKSWSRIIVRCNG